MRTLGEKMPLKLSPAIKKTYRLEKSDEEFKSETPTMIEVHIASQGQVETRNELWSEFKREYEGTKVTVSQRLSFDDVRRKEVFLTLAACNIETEDGKPLFVFVKEHLADEAAFKKAWDQLPPSVANEIHEKVLESNVIWQKVGEA
jgi:hypothetical protein